MGKPNYIQGSWLRENSIVLDVGINVINQEGKRRVVGDVDFDAVKEKAGLLTPVPGGVGPMTIAMLMRNTIRAATMRCGLA